MFISGASPFGNVGFTTTNEVVRSDQFNHITVTYDGSDLTNLPIMYVNGSPVAITQTEFASGNILDDNNAALDFTIGELDQGSPSFETLGFYDEISIWKSIIAPATISTLYNTAPASYAAAILAESPNAYWRMEDIGATVADATGGGTVGTFGGTGTTLKGVTGKVDNCVRFESDVLVNFGNQTEVQNIFQTGGTAMGYFKPQKLDGGSSSLVPLLNKHDNILDSSRPGWTVYLREPILVTP